MYSEFDLFYIGIIIPKNRDYREMILAIVPVVCDMVILHRYQKWYKQWERGEKRGDDCIRSPLYPITRRSE